MPQVIDWKKYEDEINTAPKSHHVRSFLCDNCNNVHFVMFDENDHVISHATIDGNILGQIMELYTISRGRLL